MNDTSIPSYLIRYWSIIKPNHPLWYIFIVFNITCAGIPFVYGVGNLTVSATESVIQFVRNYNE